MSIQELTLKEIDDVSGAGILGNSIQIGANLVSGFFNAVTPIGEAISLIPGVGAVHFIGDAIIQGATDTAYNIGTAFGGNVKQEKMHFADELANGTYNPAGFLKYLG